MTIIDNSNSPKNHTARNILLVFLALFLLAGSFSGGVITGWLLPDKSTLESTAQNNQTTTDTQSTQTTTDLESLFAPFWEAWDIVHQQYVDQPVDDTSLMRGAISGMLSSLGDEHTTYMNPDEYAEATSSLDGTFTYGGIGAYVSTAGQYLTITNTMPGSPAEQAGLIKGDEVIGVDGEDVTSLDPETVLNMVRGEAGKDVVLTIQRSEPIIVFEVTITRAEINPNTIISEMKDGNIAYVSILTFGLNTGDELKEVLTELMAQNPKGLILDLRGNSGGYLNTAIEVISQFISDGVVMIEKDGTGNETKYDAIPGGLATDIPLVVLVDEYSASASEITAGAIQDYDRGTLVGVTTYGKGSVQNWVPLSDDQGAVRITISRWYTPEGRTIHHVGLTPDVVVEITDDQISAGEDPQLEKAIEILLNAQ